MALFDELSLLQWLVSLLPTRTPSVVGTLQKQRRSHLLAWLLFILFGLTACTLVVVGLYNPEQSKYHAAYVALISLLLFIIFVSYLFNRSGYYYTAAFLVIVVAILGPWGSMVVDPSILQGDPIPLAYVSLSILLSSMLFHPVVTIALSLLQIIALGSIPLLMPDVISCNWTSLLTFIGFMCALCIVANAIMQRDLDDIDSQAEQLQELSEELRQQTLHDALTSLYNRRYLDTALEREVQRARRKGRQLGVVILDIDYFKRINDTYGHAAGDEVLRAFGKLIASSVRDYDTACRYGGEEFALVLPEATLDILCQRAEVIREAMQDFSVTCGGVTITPITISAGVAMFPQHGENSAALLEAADAALYRAKREGRNRVVAAGESMSVFSDTHL